MAEHNLEEKIEAGFRGVNGRLDAVDTGFRGVTARLDTLDGRVNALDTGVTARLDTLDGRVNALDTGVTARLDTLAGRVSTLETGVGGLRADVGDLKEHLFEIRDALFADNVKTRDSMSIQVEALRTDMKVHADGVIAHTEKLEDHETRITTLETR